MEDTETRLRELIVEHLGCEPERIQADTMFMDDLGADSLDTIELSMAVEEEFGVAITDAEEDDVLSHRGTFGKLLALVRNKIGEPAPAA